MPLPAEILPQLLSGSALSGQPEAQRGLWNICEGTGEGGNHWERLNCVCESELWQGPWQRGRWRGAKCKRGHTATLLPKWQTAQCHHSPARERNVTISPTCNLHCHHAYVFVRSCFGLHTLFIAHPPHYPSVLTNIVTSSVTPLTFFFLFSPSLFSPSGARGTNSAGGFNCATCWWRRCRG